MAIPLQAKKLSKPTKEISPGSLEPVVSKLVEKRKEEVQRFRSLKDMRLKALLKEVEASTSFANALLITAGCFFLLMTFRFYPIWLLPLILLGVGFAAYKSVEFGTLFSELVVFPAIAYQSPVFAWIFTLVFSITIFAIFILKMLYIASIFFILIFSPFTPLGFFMPAILTAVSLYLGSKHASYTAFLTVIFVLLFSTLWWPQYNPQFNNNSFLIFGHEPAAIKTEAPINPNKPEPSLLNLGAELASSFQSLLSWDNIRHLSPLINTMIGIFIILITDISVIIQLTFWTAAAFLIGLIPGVIENKHKNLIASLLSLLIPIGHWLASSIVGGFDPLVFLSVFFGIAFVGFLEYNGIDISRQIEVVKAEKAVKFGKFGLQDLSMTPDVESFEQIGNYEATKEELIEAIEWPLTKKELSIAYGLKPPKGILLFGPPGTGKTMMMRALAKHMKIGFYYVKCSDLLSEWYGESERNISELFKISRQTAPCVLFFDEIDSVGRSREKYSSDDVAPRLLSLMLSEMDGFKALRPVIIVGATNIPHELDKALLRPGRLDKIIYMPLPDKKGREEIFKIHTKNMPLAEDVDFLKLAEKTERYSGADIQNICMEAARRAAKQASERNVIIPISMKDFMSLLETMKPSVNLSMLEEYRKFKLDFERRGMKEREEEKVEMIRWNDVIGLDDVRNLLIEAIELPLLHEDLLKRYKVTPIKGILLFGPPGCGKTLIVKAAVNELNATFLQISGADLMKMGFSGAVGVIKETFNRARERAPAIIFIDEIDSIAPSRDFYTTPESEKVVAQLLNEMDGMKELKNVMFVGATNKPDIIDPALLRPGRFDKIMLVPPPLFENRKQIFTLNLEGIPMERVDFDSLAAKTEGFTGADIAGICQEAKMQLVRSKLKGKEEKKLTTELLLETIANRRPSITVQHLQTYIKFLEEYGERR